MCNSWCNPDVILVEFQRLCNLVRNFAALRTPRCRGDRLHSVPKLDGHATAFNPRPNPVRDTVRHAVVPAVVFNNDCNLKLPSELETTLSLLTTENGFSDGNVDDKPIVDEALSLMSRGASIMLK